MEAHSVFPWRCKQVGPKHFRLETRMENEAQGEVKPQLYIHYLLNHSDLDSAFNYQETGETILSP